HIARGGAYTEPDRTCVGRGFGRKGRCRAARGGDAGHLAINKVGGHSRQAIELILRPAVFDHDVATIDETCFAQTLTESRNEMDARLERAIMKEPNHWDRRLLRPRHERPRSR